MGDLSVPANLLNHLFISVWTHEIFMYNLCYKPMLTLSCCSDCSSSGHWELFQLSRVKCPHPFNFLIKKIFFSTSWHYKMLQTFCIFFYLSLKNQLFL